MKYLYYVYDEQYGRRSEYYHSVWDAQLDIDERITCKWSSNTHITECAVDEDGSILRETEVR